MHCRCCCCCVPSRKASRERGGGDREDGALTPTSLRSSRRLLRPGACGPAPAPGILCWL